MAETRTGWFFSVKGVNDKERDPGWDEYFSSNRSTVESLVRESIQNSLDAARLKGNSARVSIFYSGAEAALAEADYADYLVSADGQDAAAHYAAEDCGLQSPEGPCAYFVIEDFNTDGLMGDVIRDADDEPYFKFLKCENKSTKGEQGSLGKWGIGKVVFPIASQIRTFFAYSVRNIEHPDEYHPRETLVGSCLLRYHTVGDARYTPDGWWGADQVQLGRYSGRNRPVTRETDAGQTIASFKQRFRLSRTDECGLSVVVPYVEKIDFDELKQSIVENYMVALVNGNLRVELKDGAGHEAILDEAHSTEILDFLDKLAAKKDADDDVKRIAEMYRMVLEAKTIPDADVRKLTVHDGYRPEWQDGQFTEDVLASVRKDLAGADDEGNGTTVVEVPIVINKKHADEWPVATFRVVLKRCPSSSVKVRPKFYRHGLHISHVGANAVAGYMAVVLLDGPVADMMNEAEPPSHTQWFANTGRFAKIYNNAQQIIDYVKLAPRRIVAHVDDAKEDDDFEALKSYFSIGRKTLKSLKKGTGKGKGRGKKGKRKGGNRNSTPPPPKPYLLEKYIDEATGKSCFRVIADPQKFRPFMFTASLSYATLSGKSSYDENDFSMKKGGAIRVFAEGVTTRYPAANQIEALVSADRPDFMIEVKGFDPNRDLEIDDHYRDPAKWEEAQHG